MSRLSLRSRLLVVGASGVLIALLAGSLALYAVLTVVGYRTVDRSSTSTASEVADLVRSDQLPDPIPVTGSQLVQVVDGSGRVVSASVNSDRLTALLRASETRAALTGRHPVVPGSRVGLDSPLRVSAYRVDSRRTIVVAQQIGDLQHSQRRLGLAMLVLFPLLLAVLLLIASRVITAALRPVEALRSAAERISGGAHAGRLPVPPSTDEVHDLAVTLNSMLDRLAAAREREEAFVADAAHELRSPLASMRTQLDVAEHLGEGSELTHDLVPEVDRMTSLVEDLLVLARIDQHAEDRRGSEPVTLGPLVLDAVRRHAGGPVGVTAGDLPQVSAHVPPDDLRRVLDNLLDNAVRHAARAVTVTLAVTDAEVAVEICDDGAGIAVSDRDRVLDRFTRLDEARSRDAGGSGLGLAIAKALVDRSGGTIELDEAPSGGLRVTVRLPARP